MKYILLAFLFFAAPAFATNDELLAGLILHQAAKNRQQSGTITQPMPSNVVAYPVPVYQPQIIVVPECTANFNCPRIVLQCDTLPMFDQWGRIISYHKTCR